MDGSSTGTQVPLMLVLLELPRLEEPIMQAVTTIGLDIAKSVFQVHGRSPSYVTAHEAAWGLPGRHPGSSGALGSCGSPSRFTRFCTGFARCSANVFRL